MSLYACAQVRANFVGTEFTLFDSGDKPGEKKSRSSRGQPRQELASVLYQYNVLGSRGPRKMTACIPAIDASGRTLYRMQSEEDTLVDRWVEVCHWHMIHASPCLFVNMQVCLQVWK